MVKLKPILIVALQPWGWWTPFVYSGHTVFLTEANPIAGKRNRGVSYWKNTISLKQAGENIIPLVSPAGGIRE